MSKRAAMVIPDLPDDRLVTEDELATMEGLSGKISTGNNWLRLCQEVRRLWQRDGAEGEAAGRVDTEAGRALATLMAQPVGLAPSPRGNGPPSAEAAQSGQAIETEGAFASWWIGRANRAVPFDSKLSAAEAAWNAAMAVANSFVAEARPAAKAARVGAAGFTMWADDLRTWDTDLRILSSPRPAKAEGPTLDVEEGDDCLLYARIFAPDNGITYIVPAEAAGLPLPDTDESEHWMRMADLVIDREGRVLKNRWGLTTKQNGQEA